MSLLLRVGSLVKVSGEYSSLQSTGFIAVASLVAEHRFSAHGFQHFWLGLSVAAANRL